MALFAAVVACGQPRLAQQELVEAYERALAATEARARSDWTSHPGALAAAVERIQRYYENVTRDSVEALTGRLYSSDAYLCDTLHIARGAEQIEAYFLKTAERVSVMEVTILGYSASGPEVYTRWRMTIAADALDDGRPVTTYGISHLRFDHEGKVILHQDFWDASAGFFEHLPVLGGIIQRVRGGL